MVLWANLMAMLVQTMSAKLGIATGKNLPEVIRERYPRPVVWFYWVQAELIAMATDLAEFLGAALGFQLLFGLPLWMGAVLAAWRRSRSSPSKGSASGRWRRSSRCSWP